MSMLMLVFSVGDSLYALDTLQVVEVIPRVIMRKLHQAPANVAGLFNYRGEIVPVIDLCQLIHNHPSRSYLSTRIIMVRYLGKDKANCWLGLMAERITETLNQPDIDRTNGGNSLTDAPYLGEMIMDKRGMIQRIKLEGLLLDSQYKHLPSQEDDTIHASSKN